jgi:hypothetical protein
MRRKFRQVWAGGPAISRVAAGAAQSDGEENSPLEKFAFHRFLPRALEKKKLEFFLSGCHPIVTLFLPRIGRGVI